MKALSIRQPWAAAILYCGKRIENRSWPPHAPGLRYRGPVLLHASASNIKYRAMDDWDSIIGIMCGKIDGAAGMLEVAEQNMRRGGIVGRANIVDCVRRSDSPWFFGTYGFVLDNVEALPFRPCKGALGFFDVPDEVWR